MSYITANCSLRQTLLTFNVKGKTEFNSFHRYPRYCYKNREIIDYGFREWKKISNAQDSTCHHFQLGSGLVRDRGHIPLGPVTAPEGYHVHWSEFKMFDVTNSKLL